MVIILITLSMLIILRTLMTLPGHQDAQDYQDYQTPWSTTLIMLKVGCSDQGVLLTAPTTGGQ